MKKLFTIICLLSLIAQTSKAQCNWQTVLTDDFEYQTVCPNLVPGATVHNIPQDWAAHSGVYSLYLNFVNCVGTSGTCPGEKVYERGFTVCRNQPIRFSTFLTTTFAGTQCNIQIQIKDGNGTVLNDQPAISAPYAPLWLQYTSGDVTPTTDSIVFVMYTNVGGGPGNDLSMDDFLMEKCVGAIGNSTTPENVCASAVSANLFTALPGTNVTTGTWSGPSTLQGGYLGTFTPGTSLTGTYVYTNPFFGTLPGCPMAYDTLIVGLAQPPAVNLGADTTVCTNQTVLLIAGSPLSGNSFLWNNGVTGPNVLAFTSSSVAITNTYSVLVTDTNGCSNSDTISVHFQVCSGLNDLTENNVVIYPNPSNGIVYMTNDFSNPGNVSYAVVNALGQYIATGVLESGKQEISLPGTPNGIYSIRFMENASVLKTVRLVINR